MAPSLEHHDCVVLVAHGGHGQVDHVGLVQRVHAGVHHTLVALVGLHSWESQDVWGVQPSQGVLVALVDPCDGVVLEAS